MPTKKHDFTATEIKAGALVIAAASMLVLFIGLIAGLRPSRAEKTFFSDFSDIRGLNVGADVRFAGTRAGVVTSIDSSPRDRSRLRVTWTVGDGIPVCAASTASISYVSLVGEMHLEVSGGSRDAELLESGSEVPTGPPGGMLGALDVVAAPLSEALKADGVLGDLRKILGVAQAESDPSRKLTPIAEVLANTNSAVTRGADLVGDMRETIVANRKSFEEALARLRDIEDGAQKLIDQLDGILTENRGDIRKSIEGARALIATATTVADDLNGASELLDSVLRNAGSLSDAAKGLLAEHRPALEDILGDLRASVRDLRRFSQILAAEPQALIYGKSPAGRE